MTAAGVTPLRLAHPHLPELHGTDDMCPRCYDCEGDISDAPREHLWEPHRYEGARCLVCALYHTAIERGGPLL